MPIEGGMNPGEAEHQVAGTPPPDSTPPPATPESTPAIPSGQPAAPAGPAAPAAAFSLRDFASQQYPAVKDRYQSDEALARELLQAAMLAQQQQPYAQIGQRMSPYVSEFEQWRAEQEQRKAAEAAQTQAKWWQPPEYDPAWEKGVITDPQTGRLVPLPGFPIDLPARIEKFREFQRQKFQDFTRDPIGLLKEGIVPLIEERARAIVAEQMAAAQANQFATTYVNQQIGWLAQKDAQGNPIRNAQGGYLLTPAGERFNQHVTYLKNQGVLDPRVQAEMAEKILMGELAQLQARPAPAPAPGQPARPAFPTNQPNYGDTGVPKPGQSVRDMLREALQAAGLYSPQAQV